MRCRYCGAENPEHELRCMKCQRRIASAAQQSAPDSQPFIHTATAPDVAHDLAAAPAPARPVLAASRPDAQPAARNCAAVQPALFPYREQRKVIGFEEYSQPLEQRRAADSHRGAPKRKPMPGQGAFDFDGPTPPARPLTRQLSRRTDFPVAPLQLRAMAALFDAGLVLGLLGVFLLTVRLGLGFLPLQTPFLFCYGGAVLAFAATYKLLFCMFGQVTFGLQGAHLYVVSFDGLRPTVSQRFMRMFSGWLSLTSAGMGVLWAVADQESLSWHDHISQTFLTHLPPETED